MKQISIQISEEAARQIAALARLWGLPEQRHNTPVIERCVERVYQQIVNGAEVEPPPHRRAVA